MSLNQLGFKYFYMLSKTERFKFLILNRSTHIFLIVKEHDL